MMNVTVPVIQNNNAVGLPLPTYATADSAGMDLYAAIPGPMRLQPGEWELIPTGISVALPKNCEAQIRSRSGLAAKSGIVVLNSPGTIDADYRGEIFVVLYNASKRILLLERGMKIAQKVVAPVLHVDWTPIDSLNATTRGKGGFGSTGV